MKKRVLCLCMIFIFLTGCQVKNKTKFLYSGSDGTINSDIGTYTLPTVAEFMTKDIVVIEDSQNHMQDENITAIASMMIDVTNDKVIFANNVYEKLYPASTTKILTALLALQYGNLEDQVTISEDDGGITIPGAKLCHFKKGDVVTMRTLLNCLLVYSGNDAAIAIAEHISGSVDEFVKQMNEEAARLGAVDTHFVNPHGLHDDDHYTTAYDMYLILRECLKYDEFKKIIKQPKYTAVYENALGETKTCSYETTNMFLLGTKQSPEGITVIGGKTGSTGNAGDCLILYSEDASGNGYVTEVFKAKSKENLYDQLSYLLKLFE